MEILRRESKGSEELFCLKCGNKIHLYFNGGELDSEECCGYKYFTEHNKIDFIIKKVD